MRQKKDKTAAIVFSREDFESFPVITRHDQASQWPINYQPSHSWLTFYQTNIPDNSPLTESDASQFKPRP